MIHLMHIIGEYVVGKHYVVGYIFAKPCVGMRMGKMAVLGHASLMPDYLTSVSS